MQDLPDKDQGPSPEAGGMRESNGDTPPPACGQGAAQGLHLEDRRADGNILKNRTCDIKTYTQNPITNI